MADAQESGLRRGFGGPRRASAGLDHRAPTAGQRPRPSLWNSYDSSCRLQDAGTAGHGPSGDSTPGTGPLPPITLQRAGGFAGLRDTVVLDPHGVWTVTDRAGARRAGELTEVQFAVVKTLATDPALAVEAGRTRAPSRCADAYHYVLVVGTARIAYADCPADPDQPTAGLALARQLLQVTGLNRG